MQNLWCFFEDGEEKYGEHTYYNFWWMCLDWPSFFPDVLEIYKEIEERHERYCPGAPCNKGNFFNKLRHWEKKGKRKKIQ